jgi:MFS family permease
MIEENDPTQFFCLVNRSACFVRRACGTPHLLKMNRYNLLCIIYCSFGAFFYGYDSGLTTSIIGYPEFISYFDFNATTLGALGSAYYAGNFVGSLCNVWLPDKYGRLNVVRFASVISIVGAGMQTGAQSLGVLLAGRAIGGIACGKSYLQKLSVEI